MATISSGERPSSWASASLSTQAEVLLRRLELGLAGGRSGECVDIGKRAEAGPIRSHQTALASHESATADMKSTLTKICGIQLGLWTPARNEPGLESTASAGAA